MTPPFDFVPRKLAKAAKKPAPVPPRETVRPNAPQKEPVNNASDSTQTGSQRPEAGEAGRGAGSHTRSTLADTDYVNLMYLALSDYALWSNPDLRRIIDWGTSPESGGVDGEREFGFLPLSHLQDHSHILSSIQLLGHHNTIAKAIRTCASDLLELRLLVTSDSSWFPNHNTAHDPGIYELRRKDPGTLQHLSKDEWNKRTLYVEQIPAQYRSIHGIANFVLKMLASSQGPNVSCSRLQNILLPPHHLDKPNEPPLCKGFALVTFSNLEDLTDLADAWPWHRKYRHPKESPPHITEAMKFGFRVLPKVEWDKLKTEYLAYHSRLVEEINAQQDAERSMSAVPVTPRGAPENALKDTREDPLPTAPPPQQPEGGETFNPTIDQFSPYPYSCLVYIRNIHPETNKTTIRTLLARAFVGPIGQGVVNSDGLDYVDFTKGTDSCHLRLATPQHAEVLIEYIKSNPTIQVQGLDDTGSPPSPTTAAKPIAMELVTGMKEKLYWQKVPEKVRRQAVEKAMRLMSGTSSVPAKEPTEGEEAKVDTRKRKRRKH